MYQNWNELKEKVLNCQDCPLNETRNNVVFGVGNPNSRVLFIGEAPGKEEDAQGEPFIGRSGQLLDKLLTVIDLDRNKNIYIANMVKCRPPENRDPKPAETEACIGYLRNQVALLRPKIIVCVGRVAATRLIAPEFKVTIEHGKFIEKNGVLMMGTYHPAALLRNPNNKPYALEDFQKLREKILEIAPETFSLER